MANRNYDELKVSDETGEAVIANIESDRSIAATTLDVDSVDNWPNKAIIATGDKVLAANGSYYIEPSSMTIMYGHLDSGDFIVDGFAPGYTDSGNTSGQIAVIKPNTYWADEIVALAQVAHNADGTLKTGIVTTAKMADSAVTAEKLGVPVAARAYASSTLGISASTWTKAPLNTENFDIGSNFDTTNYRFVAPYKGVYLVAGQVGIASNGLLSTAFASGALYLNGSEYYQGLWIHGAGDSSILPRIPISTFISLEADDYLELYGYCSEGSRNIVADTTFLSVALIGRQV